MREDDLLALLGGAVILACAALLAWLGYHIWEFF